MNVNELPYRPIQNIFCIFTHTSRFFLPVYGLGTAMKRKTYLSKNFWDERYFVFRSNHVLEYYRKKTDSADECRGKLPISHRTGCDISDLYVRKHKNELMYCMTISFTQLDYETAIIESGGNDNLNNSIGNIPDMNMEDENSSIGNVSRNYDIADSNQSIGENYIPHSDMALNGSINHHSPRLKRGTSPHKKPIVGITKLLASPFIQNRRSISNESNKTPVSLRSVDAESVTFGSQQQKRMNGLLRQRRPNALSRRAVSHAGVGNSNNNNGHQNQQDDNRYTRRYPTHSSAMSVDGPFVPTTVEVPISHRTSIPPPIISTTIKPRSNSTTTVDGDTTNLHNHQNTDASAMVENGTIISSVTPVISNNRRTSNAMNNNNNDDEEVDEQELLRSEYITTKEKDKHKAKDMVVQSTKLAAAVGATVSLTVLTAGVGLVAGLIVLGVAGAAGGGGAAVNATWLRNSKGSRTKYEMSIAFYDYDVAKQWKSILDAALESDIVHKSTWGQLFTSDGRMARAALLPKLRQISADSKLVTDRTTNPDGTGGKIIPFRRNAKWTLIEGGLLAIVGCGFQGLRIYREEHDTACRRLQRRRLFPTITGHPLPPPPQVYESVDGKPCPPMKAHVVLSTSPLDAFLCLMSHGRVDTTKVETEYDIMDDEDDMFDSDYRISFEIIECIDENTDIIRMIYRPMFLFPAWTHPRDFVLFRYWRLDPDGSYVVCYESMVHPKCPPVANYVRGEMHSVFHIAPQKKSSRHKSKIKTSQPVECLMTATVQVDPKGWVPTIQWSCLSNQAYGDAFGIYALLKLIDIRDAIDEDRFVAATSDHPVKLSSQQHQSLRLMSHQTPDGTGMPLPLSPASNFALGHGLTRNASTDTNDDTLHEDYMDYDFTYAGNESTDFPQVTDGMTRICSRPPPLTRRMWAEPDSNSFRVRGVHYKHDRLKYNAGPSIGRLMCVDVVSVDKPLYSGFSLHPTERIQLALQKERELLAKGLESDLPPFIFIVNICLPGPPYYHGVYYYAVNDIRTINGMDGTPSSKLCREFLFGDSDEFRDRTFKLIPQIVQGNFIVRKAVGSTPAIMGKKLRQLYVKHERYFEVILDCGSSPVATGVIRLSLGYAKSLVVDMGFVLEGDDEEHLPERIFGCVRMKSIDFGPHLRHVMTFPTSSGLQPEPPPQPHHRDSVTEVHGTF